MKEFRLAVENVPLPPGTDVVLKVDLKGEDGSLVKAGSVARVEVGHHHTYHLVTPHGLRVVAGRDELAIQKRAVAEALLGQAEAFEDLAGCAIYRAVVGSVAWGLAGEGSDVDTRGVFVLPFDRATSLFRQPEEIRDPEFDTEYWEVEKFLHLLLRSDANAIELLWSPEILHSTDLAERIRRRRRDFLSQNVVGSFGRYALSQIVKIENRLEDERRGKMVAELVRGGLSERKALERELAARIWPGERPPVALQRAEQAVRALVHSIYDRGLIARREFDAFARFLVENPDRSLFAERPYRPKNAYNLLRLLRSGLSLVRSGEPLIRVEGPLRDRLLAVKRSEVEIGLVIEEASALGRELEEAATRSVLPMEPPYRLADELLRAARREAARKAFRTPSGRARAARRPLAEVAPRDSIPFSIPGEAWDFVLDRVDHGLVQLGLVGSHAYGFPSPDSDIDLKGIHLASARTILGLAQPEPTCDRTQAMGGLEVDFTSHEAGQALRLLAAGSGNILERLLSPYQLVVGRIPRALRRLAARSIGPHFSRHYRGFLSTLIAQLAKEAPPEAKTVLYIYRVALTGLHLLREGELVLDVRELAPRYGRGAEVPPLIAAKLAEGARLDARIDLSGALALAGEFEAEILRHEPEESRAPRGPGGTARLADRLLVALRKARDLQPPKER